MRAGKIAAAAALAAVLTASEGAAIWAPLTMAQLVEHSELIVIGELISVEEAPAAATSAAGTIQVEEVLRAPAAQRQTSSVALELPSRIRRMASDAVMYKPGQRGIWFLRRDSNTGGLVADNPQRLMPLSELANVRKFLGSLPAR